MNEINNLIAQLEAEEIRKCYHKITVYSISYSEGNIRSSQIRKKFCLYLVNFGTEFLKIQLPCVDTLTCSTLINLIKNSGIIQHKKIRLSSNYRTQSNKEPTKITLKDIQCYLKTRIQDYEESHQVTVHTAHCVLVSHKKIVTDGRTKVSDSSVVLRCEIIDQNGNRMMVREKDGYLEECEYFPNVLDQATPKIDCTALEICRDSKKILCIDANIVKKCLNF